MQYAFGCALGATALLALAPASAAQGSDDCASATAISGTGTFAVSTVGATDSPQQSGSCAAAHGDVWFRWTAPQSGTASFHTCGGVSVDSVLAVYSGAACPLPGTLLACNDDSCGLQSSLSFSAVAGATYMLQLGAFGAGTTYSGTFALTFAVPPANDACTAAQVISGSGPFPFDTQLASTGAEGQSNALCGTPPGIERDLWYAWTAASSVSMMVRTCGSAAFDTKIAVYAGAGCPAGAAIGCNDDACGLQTQVFFTAVAGSTYTIQLGSYPGAPPGAGSFEVVPGSGGCPSPSSGPDLIVGAITDVLNATAANGIDAFAVGMTACNVGDAVVDWWASTNRHPVIATNLYRYQVVGGSGRFEQVGMSWLKHGFGAATENACCTCLNPGNYQLLGVGCADTYSAGLNGNQPALGPRWQVDAHTGVFTYPPANPSWSGATARRCEVALADLTPTGGGTRYYCEGAYVTQDDAAAGNQDNNSSYEEMTVATAGLGEFQFGTTGGTLRMLTALEAWPAIEAGVVLSDVRVPGDGRILVASQATPLGGGLHHYEFSVHNQNSGRNVGSFRVPLPAGASVTNVGFHDVAYRNGDGPGNVNVDGADWSVAIGAAGIAWTTAPEATNPGANCIRWGTTYNFRFDADVAPASASVTFGLWKPGSPEQMAAVAEVPAGASMTESLCFGDGSGAPCPCGNDSPAGSGAGCLSSLGVGGALSASGTPSIASDTLAMLGSGMPDSSALYFQGTTTSGAGAGTAFGDGLRCAAGTVVRLGTKLNAGGSSQYPGAGDAAISVQGGTSAGDVRTYQCWYRNAAAFCTADTFNLTSAVRAAWQP